MSRNKFHCPANRNLDQLLKAGGEPAGEGSRRNAGLKGRFQAATAAAQAMTVAVLVAGATAAASGAFPTNAALAQQTANAVERRRGGPHRGEPAEAKADLAGAKTDRGGPDSGKPGAKVGGGGNPAEPGAQTSGAAQPLVTAESFDLRFLNEQILRKNFQGLPVGGISGASFNSRSGRFLFLSDDKKNHRFYKLRLQNGGPPYKLHITEQVFFKETGRQSPARNMDPEAIFFHPPSQDIFTASEGQQIFAVPEPPEILQFSLSGRLKRAWPVSDVFWPRALAGALKQNGGGGDEPHRGGAPRNGPDSGGPHLGETARAKVNTATTDPAGFPKGSAAAAGAKPRSLKIGPYENKGFESLAFDPQNQILWTATEAPLRQDSASLKADCCIRISGFSMKSRQLTRQHGYKTAAKGAGLTEMLFLEPDVFLTLEREYIASGAKGARPTTATVVAASPKTDGKPHLGGPHRGGPATSRGASVQPALQPAAAASSERNVKTRGEIVSFSKTKPRLNKSNGVNKVRLFVTDCSRASDLVHSKKRLPLHFQPCEKSLLFDFDSLAKDGVQADNLEAMAFGPVLRLTPDPVGSGPRPSRFLRPARNGTVRRDSISAGLVGKEDPAARQKRLLVIVADNNFRPQAQSNQILFFQFSEKNRRQRKVAASSIR